MNIDEKLLMNHKSVRKFNDQPVNEELLKKIIRCAQHASTSEFIQAYTIIHVTDDRIKREIYDQVTEQKPILNAPVFLMFCANVNRLLSACAMNGQTAPKEYMEYTETFLTASMDTAIAAQNAVVAAESAGLGCTYIGGIRNDLAKIIELLQLPKGVYPLFGMIMGYPLENTEETAKPRLPLEVVYKQGCYSDEGDEERIREYDRVIRDYYIKRTDGERDETWTEQMTEFVQKPHRPSLKKALNGQGFMLK